MIDKIPQSVTLRVPLQAYLASDHISPGTGKTIPVTISKNGAAYANPSGGATNAVSIGNGSYYVDLSTTDTGTLGPLFISGTEGTIDNIIAIFNIVNAHNLGFDGLPNAAAESAGGLYTRGAGAGQINQDANGRIDTRWVTGNVTVGTNGDKTGYTLSSAGIQAIFDYATSLLTTAGSIGKLLVDNINQTISNVYTRIGAPVGASISADIAALPTATVNANAILDQVNAIETGYTLRMVIRILFAGIAGDKSGFSTTSPVVKSNGGAKTRLSSTNADIDGNGTWTIDGTP